MSVPSFNTFSEVLSSGLEALLLGLILFRRPARQVQLFVVYMLVLVGRELWWDTTFRRLHGVYQGAEYHTIYVVYWASDFLLSVLRLATCVQIWWLSVRGLTVIWRFSWRVLAAVSGLLFLWSVASAASHRDKLVKFFYVGLERFEFMQAAVLVTILALALYYSVDFRPGYTVFLVGLCMYSLEQCATASLSAQNPILTYRWFNEARLISFWLVEGLWIYGLARMAPSEPRRVSPALQHAYGNLSPVVNYRLEALNHRLADMLRL